jgi:hypothetical protein
MSKNTKPGPKVKINGVEYETVMNDSGVQCFPENKVVNLLYDGAKKSGYNLNKLWEECKDFKDRRTRDGVDMRAFYRLIGMSVYGYAEVFEDDEIDNPLWKK